MIGVPDDAAEERAMAEEKIGVVIHYWNHIGVAGIHVSEGEVRVGDTIRIKGHTSDFTQQVDSMQVNNQQLFS